MLPPLNDSEVDGAAMLGDVLHTAMIQAINVLVDCARAEGVSPRVIITALVAETTMLSAAVYYKMNLERGFCDSRGYLDLHREAIRTAIADHAD